MNARRKFAIDALANMGSLVSLAATGLFMNAIIAKVYAADGLGMFNSIFSVYILLSQVATFGVQFSVMKSASEREADTEESADIVAAALYCAAIAALATICLAYLLLNVPASYVLTIRQGLIYAFPGLWFFALNKVLLNAFNAAQANTIFAALTSLRHVTLAGSIGAISIAAESADVLPAALTISEASVFVCAVVLLRFRFPKIGFRTSKTWWRYHLHFGMKSLPGGVATELNTRIDVILLGLLTNQSAVGLYSFSAFFMEGILQIPAVARRLLDPPLARMCSSHQPEQLRAFLAQVLRFSLLGMGLISILSVAAYPWFAPVFGTPSIATETWVVFGLLMVGAFVYGSHVPISGIFSQAGLPGIQSKLNTWLLVLNLAFNAALIPFLGIEGAALGTALSYCVGTLYLWMLLRKVFGFSWLRLAFRGQQTRGA